MDNTMEAETPEQIAFYKAEIERMFAEMDASEERRREQQKRIDSLVAKTQVTLDDIRVCTEIRYSR